MNKIVIIGWQRKKNNGKWRFTDSSFAASASSNNPPPLSSWMTSRALFRMVRIACRVFTEIAIPGCPRCSIPGNNIEGAFIWETFWNENSSDVFLSCFLLPVPISESIECSPVILLGSVEWTEWYKFNNIGSNLVSALARMKAPNKPTVFISTACHCSGFTRCYLMPTE